MELPAPTHSVRGNDDTETGAIELRRISESLSKTNHGISSNASRQQPEPLSDNNSHSDSAYMSLRAFSNTDKALSSNDLSIVPRRRKISGHELYIYRIPKDESAFRAYKSITNVVEQALGDEIIAAGLSIRSNLGIHLEMIGSEVEVIKPRMLVFFSIDVESIVLDVLESPQIQAVFQSRSPRYPSLTYVTVSRGTRSRSSNIHIDVCCANTQGNMPETYCGASILLRHTNLPDSSITCRLATSGGVLKIEYSDGTVKFFGMTAGHAAEYIRSKIRERKQPTKSSEDLESWIYEQVAIGPILGKDEMRGTCAGQAEPSHDWALFSLKAPKPNVARAIIADGQTTDKGRLILVPMRPLDINISVPVVMLGSRGRTYRGEISGLPARYWVGHARKFVDAYMFELSNDEEEISDGISGSWVVHSAAPGWYGHVVATSPMGDAYVLPASDTLNNIRDCMGAKSASLPTQQDFGIDIPLKPASLVPPAVPCWEPDGSHSNNFLVKTWRSLLYACHGQRPKFHGYAIAPSDNLHSIDLNTEIISSVAQYSYNSQEMVQKLKEFAVYEPLFRNRAEMDRAAAWIYDCAVERSSTKPYRMTASELYVQLSKHIEINVSEIPHTKGMRYVSIGDPNLHKSTPDRRIMIIEDLDPRYIMALFKSAPRQLIVPLLDAINKYLSGSPSMSVRLPEVSHSIFELSFHLPCYTIKTSKIRSAFLEKQRQFFDLSFMNSVVPQSSKDLIMQQEHISVTICGRNEVRWTCHAFLDQGIFDGSCYQNGAENDETSSVYPWDISDDSDEELPPCWSNNCVYGHRSSEVAWDQSSYGTNLMCDPRLYWLYNLFIATSKIRYEWHKTCRHLEYAFQSWRQLSGFNKTSSTFEQNIFLQKETSIDYITSSLMILGQLQTCLSASQNVWSSFQDTNGDINYFEDIVDPKATQYLRWIRTMFEEMRELYSTLENERSGFERILQTFQSRLLLKSQLIHSESHRLAQQSAHLNSQTTDAHLKANQIRQNSYTISLILLMMGQIYIPFAVAIALYTSDRELLPFRRTLGNFFATAIILLVVTNLIIFVFLTFSRSLLLRKILAGSDRIWVRSKEKEKYLVS